MVFLGSENAGHLVSSVSSVGPSVAADDAYDVVIVRHRSPAKIAKLQNASPVKTPKSDFISPSERRIYYHQGISTAQRFLKSNNFARGTK
jgi:hypothetical protein